MSKTLVAVLMVLVLTTVIFAQNTPRFGRPPIGNAPVDGSNNNQRQPVDPLTGLKAALSLTDAQVEAIRAHMQTRATRAEALRMEIQQKRQALNALLDAATPNPADVGNAAIALRASEKKLPGEQDWFIAELKKLLTGDQQQKLDTLLAANRGFLGGGGPGGRRGGPR